MLTLRRRSKSRDRTNSCSRTDDIPSIITIPIDNSIVEDVEDGQSPKPIMRRKSKSSRSRKRETKSSERNLTQTTETGRQDNPTNPGTKTTENRRKSTRRSRSLGAKQKSKRSTKSLGVQKGIKSTDPNSSEIARSSSFQSKKSICSQNDTREIDSVNPGSNPEKKTSLRRRLSGRTYAGPERSLSFTSLSNKSDEGGEKKIARGKKKLREKLLKESMREIDRRQKQAREQAMVSSPGANEQQKKKEFDELMKRCIKQDSTRGAAIAKKGDEWKSIPHTSILESVEYFEKKRSKNILQPVPSLDDISNIETTSCRDFSKKTDYSEHKSPKAKPGWRQTVSSMIAVARSRSNSRSRSKDRSLSKSGSRVKSKSRSRSKGRAQKIGKNRSRSESPSHSSKGPETTAETSKKLDDTIVVGSGNEPKTRPELPRLVDDGMTSMHTSLNDGEFELHYAIMRHDWDIVRTMLKNYDHRKYQQEQNRKMSPLLRVDKKGQTPFHLACKEHMPSKLLCRLLFVERGAASVKDSEGRYPLHLVLMHSLNQNVLDRTIHAYPDGLGAPDLLKHTPIQYAILKADRSRQNQEVTWGPPTTKEHEARQKQLIEAYENVSFVLESMEKRNKYLSVSHESETLIEAMKVFVPPAVVYRLVRLSEKILCKDQTLSEQLVDLVFESEYTLDIIHTVVESTSKIIPEARLLEMIRPRLNDHFDDGCMEITINVSEGETLTTTLASQFAKGCRKGLEEECNASPSCQLWWEKLEYLIGRSCDRSSNGEEDTLLHLALLNPLSKPALIEYLCRLHKVARYKSDVVTGALPIHLACIHWHPEKHGVCTEKYYNRVLNLLLAGDFDLVRKVFQGRNVLHYAIIHGKSMQCIQNILNLYETAAMIRDPTTKLLPFQLAATSEKYDNSELTEKTKPSTRSLRSKSKHLNVIFNLLRESPSSLSLSHNRSNLVSEMNPLTRHVLRWCYDLSLRGTTLKWKLNTSRKAIIRNAINYGQIPDTMKKWFSELVKLIWEAHDARKRPILDPKNQPTRSNDYFLHATLWSSAHIPPIAIELILEFYSHAAHTKEPETGFYPVHITSKVQTYIPLSFEKTLSMGSALTMITLLNSGALAVKAREGKLPLHMAIESGKSWQDLRAMIAIAPHTLSVRDPSTGLLPFQMAARGSSILPNIAIIGAKMGNTKSKMHTAEENARELRFLRQVYGLDKLTSIFTILRAKPEVIDMRR